jgi:type IV pilus modification protein PilV
MMLKTGTRGFTLVELLVAMLILAIGIMATMSMQFSSLAGAMISRDNSNASDVAQRVMQIMRVESQQWRTGNSVGGVAPAYDATGRSYVASSANSFLESAVGAAPAVNGWDQWTSLFTNPVNTRLTTEGAARYCVYVRGGAVNATGRLLIVHVAVVFPSANQVFANNTCLAANAIQAQLDPTMLATNDASLQMMGYRVQYFGTQISRKDYLSGRL